MRFSLPFNNVNNLYEQNAKYVYCFNFLQEKTIKFKEYCQIILVYSPLLADLLILLLLTPKFYKWPDLATPYRLNFMLIRVKIY